MNEKQITDLITKFQTRKNGLRQAITDLYDILNWLHANVPSDTNLRCPITIPAHINFWRESSGSFQDYSDHDSDFRLAIVEGSPNLYHEYHCLRTPVHPTSIKRLSISYVNKSLHWLFDQLSHIMPPPPIEYRLQEAHR